MENTLNKVEELYKSTPESVLTIIEKNSGGGYLRVVRAPLPDGFGMSVGSAFTDPQNIDLASHTGAGKYGQIASAIMRGAAALTGFSTRAVQNSNVFYGGPEPTEISFDLQFNSYYSAREEVLIPAAKLMMMSVGVERTLRDLNERVSADLEAQEIDPNDKETESIMSNFGLIRSAGICEVRFGKTFKIPRAYVSSVGVKFSNVLDNMGIPTSADCSVTIKVVRNPTQREVGERYFAMRGL